MQDVSRANAVLCVCCREPLSPEMEREQRSVSFAISMYHTDTPYRISYPTTDDCAILRSPMMRMPRAARRWSCGLGPKRRGHDFAPSRGRRAGSSSHPSFGGRGGHVSRIVSDAGGSLLVKPGRKPARDNPCTPSDGRAILCDARHQSGASLSIPMSVSRRSPRFKPSASTCRMEGASSPSIFSRGH